MSASNFKTQNDTYRKLFGNGLTYHIPMFQRDYSWTDTEWQELWSDIQEILESDDSAHYMGYLVLQTKDDRSFDVIDGQQRLTTMSIIMLSILRCLKKVAEEGESTEQNQRRINEIRSNYIGHLDTITLITEPKLSLNRNNDDYYQQYMVPLRELPKRNISSSEHSMRKASDWFFAKIQHFISKNKNSDDIGVLLAKLVQQISDKLFFTVITVSDELNAYKVFETLNARGVRLSATDLLKNYFFSVIHNSGVNDREMQAVDNRWAKIVTRLGEAKVTDFLRTHWISRHGVVRKPNLFKTIKRSITNRDNVFELISALEDDIDPYLGMTSPDSSDWDDSVKANAALLKLFRVTLPYPLLIAAKHKLDNNTFANLLSNIVTISIRYNVIGGLQANDQENIYSSVAQQISRGELITENEILKKLKSIYPSDDSFRSSFADKEIKTTDSRNNRIVKYILTAIERQLFEKVIDYNDPKVTVEHILPQNPENGWDQFSDHDHELFLYRLGNMTLMQVKGNRDIENYPFNKKKEVLKQSIYDSTKSLGLENNEWEIENIKTRQKKMARTATAIWRIGQLS